MGKNPFDVGAAFGFGEEVEELQKKNKRQSNNQTKGYSKNSGKKNSSYNRQTNQYNKGGSGKAITAKSPYNFIEIEKRSPKMWLYDKKDLPKHDSFEANRHNGYIDYTIETVTPTIVCGDTNKGEEKCQIMNNDGQYIIQGNTIRGLIRNNCQILSMSSYLDDIDGNVRHMFRSVADRNALSDLKKLYGNILGSKIENRQVILKNLKVGYISCHNKKYLIQPAKEINGNRYFKIHDGILREINQGVPVDYMYNRTDVSYREYKSTKDYKDNYNRKRSKNNRFKPYYANEMTFELNGKKVMAVGKNSYKHKGSIMCSKWMYKKVHHVIIPEADGDQLPIELDRDVIADYNNYLKRNKLDRTGNGNEYYFLPKEGEIKPVFYIQHNGHIYFGFTEYLKLFFENTVEAGVKYFDYNDSQIDNTKAIFGFTDKELSYKSRVSFLDAVEDKVSVYPQSLPVMQGSPKSTFYSYYIKQKDAGITTYADKDFELNGIKQYWLKDKITYVQNVNDKNKYKNMISYIRPIDKASTFKGRIYFEQLNDAELGLLLWSIYLDEKAQFNIGNCKALGFGRIKIKDLQLNIENLEKKYDLMMLSDYYTQYSDVKMLSFIDCYKKEVKDKADIDLDVVQSIKDFITMKTHVVDDKYYGEFGYLELGEHKERPKLKKIEMLKNGKRVKPI